MHSDRKRIVILVLIMVVVTLVSSGLAILILGLS